MTTKSFPLASLIVILMGILLTNSAGFNENNSRLTTSCTSTSQCITFDLEIPNIETSELIVNDIKYASFAIEGEGCTYDHDRPMLPAISRFVVVPPRDGLDLVYHSSEPQRFDISEPVVLCRDEDLTTSPFPLLAYGGVRQHGYYPPVIAEMSEPFIIRGVRLVKVTTYPIQYNPATGEYFHREHITAEIRSTKEAPVNPVEHLLRHNRSRVFLDFIEALAINGDQVRRDQPDDEAPEYVGHYLVVTHENCLQYAAPFIEWRRKAGYKVEILSLSANNAGDEEFVSDAIQEIYDDYLDDGIDPFDFLLLIGDRTQHQYGPNAQWILNAESGVSIWGNPPHADYEYACLEGRDDHHPDVGFARWPN